MVSDRAGLRPAAERARRVYVFVSNTSIKTSVMKDMFGEVYGVEVRGVVG